MQKQNLCTNIKNASKTKPKRAKPKHKMQKIAIADIGKSERLPKSEFADLFLEPPYIVVTA